MYSGDMTTDECICKKKSHLHIVNCPVVLKKTRSSLFVLEEEAFKTPNSNIFFISNDSVELLNKFRSNLPTQLWLYEVVTGKVGTINLSNGSEITFMPENEALHLLDFPKSHRIFIVGSHQSKDIAEALNNHTDGIILVDPTNGDIL